MSCTDTFNFNSTDMFNKIRAGLPYDKNKTQNLIECKDDLLYAWDSDKCCLYALNWRVAKFKGFNNVKHQALIPSTQRNFQVDKILASPDGSMIALAGSNGLSILELPNRWGPNGYFLEGKDEIICRSCNLHEDVFENNSHLELLQIRWHPASPTDSHILLLLSDNTICVYDDFKLKHIWRIGPTPSFQPLMNTTTTTSPSSKFSLLYSLGEAAVDFDIAPPRVLKLDNKNEDNTALSSTALVSVSSSSSSAKNNMKNIRNSRINNESTYSLMQSLVGGHSSITNNKNGSAVDYDIDDNGHKSQPETRVEWPILILRENGNIYVLCAGIDTDRPKLQGPLTIQPQTEDNYGIDSCSLLVIPSLPPTLIIAENTGKIHHALMIEADTKEDSFNEIDSTLLIHPSEWTINVVETVELELGLYENSKKVKSHTCPIHLKRDFINEFRYFAYHNTGLHVIFLNFVKQLQSFVDSDDALEVPLLSVPSTSEYIVCTKVEDQNKVNAVLGFVLLQMPSGIVLLLGSGQVISLNLIINPNLLPDWNTVSGNQINSNQNKLPLDSPIQKIMGESFVTHIQNILSKSVTQPILSLDKANEPSLQECYELLTQAIQVLHEQYFKKHEQARIEIGKRVEILKSLKEKQKLEVEHLEKQKELIQHDAEVLAERYEDIYEKQQSLLKKCQDLVRQTNVSIPSNTIADKEFSDEINKIYEKTQKMTKFLTQSQDKLKNQQHQMKNYFYSSTKNEIILPQKEENTIKEILSQLTSEIDYQIKEIKKIFSILNL